jgi:hypothetical protein
VERTRVAAFAALSVMLSVAGAAFAAGARPMPAALGSVSWPVSTLLVSEVQTGGASASDEFAEITNVGASTVDLAGLELAYATSSGSTVTRKASWATSLLLEPGRHLLVANSLGIYAGLADATYSGGFAATGGAIVLRAIGGATIDAVGWGDATNAFVEGSPIAAPAAGASIERMPGGLAGNTIDTNSNSADWLAQSNPNPQSLAAPPVPAPTPTATPTASPGATVSPTGGPTPPPTVAPTATPAPTPSPVPTPTVVPSPTLSPTPTPTSEPSSIPSDTPSPEPTVAPTSEPTVAPTPEPTLAPTLEPTAGPTPLPTIAPTAAPTAAPTPTPQAVTSVAVARSLPDGSTATIIGVLTTGAGALEAERKGFVQDETAGIALYLDAPVVDGPPAGTLVMATGTIDDRFAERTLRVSVTDLLPLGEGAVPAPVFVPSGSIGEAVEGSRVVVTGTTVGSPSTLADGLGLMVDDGTGQVRVIVAPAALGGLTVPSGTSVVAVGPVGQRDSSGTGLSGYRIHVTVTGDFQVLPPPDPSPTPIPSPAPTASPTPSTTPTPSATPVPSSAPSATPATTARPTVTPAPTPGPTPPPVIDIVEARGAAAGTVVTVSGVVTAEAGRLGLPPVIAIADGTGGIAIRLPEGAERPARGTIVLVKGALADPYGQLELRPAAGGYAVTGRGSLPGAIRLMASQLGEATEGRLAELTGTLTAPPRKGTSGDLTIDLVDAAGAPFRVFADGSSGITAADLAKDRGYRLTGIVGQHASRKGALDGYRLHVRDRGDVVTVAVGAGPGASASPGATTAAVPVSTALAVPDGTRVTIEATVSAGASLLDASGRRIVVQDRTAAIEILLPTGTDAPDVGARLRVTGTTGLAWGAPRIAATEVATLGVAAVQPLVLRRAPAERDEWLLVRLSGTIAKVTRIGERWRAELTLADGTAALVQGQAGAGIPSTSIAAGRSVTVTGIVRRPYPTASDRRFAVLPRSTSDVDVVAGGTGAGNGSGPSGPGSQGGAAAASADPGAAAITPDTDLATLADLVGRRVKVGGLIARIADDGFDLDDGTALARVELRGDMHGLLPHLRQGEAVAATGTVDLIDGAPVVVVDEEGDLVRVGTLGEGLPIGDAVPAASAGEDGEPVTADASGGLGGPGPMSLFALASLAGLSVLATVVRRRLVRRRLRFALVDRLRGLPGDRAPSGGSGSSTASAESEHEFA